MIHIRKPVLSGARWNNACWKKVVEILCTWKSFMILPALFAMVLRAIITYIVITDSIGIILTSGSVKDTVFNCLAITFILELNSVWWKVLQTVFHFTPEEMSKVEIPFNKRCITENTEKRIQK